MIHCVAFFYADDGMFASIETVQTYWYYLLSAVGQWDCVVEGCKGRAATSLGLCVHFLHLHVQYTVVILE